MAFHFRHIGTSICPQEFNSLKIHLLWKIKRVEVYAVNFQYNKIWRRTRASDVLIDYKQNTSSATQSFKPLAKQSLGNCQNWRLDIEKTEQKILGVVARGVFRMLRHVVWQEPGSDDLIQPGVPAGVPSFSWERERLWPSFSSWCPSNLVLRAFSIEKGRESLGDEFYANADLQMDTNMHGGRRNRTGETSVSSFVTKAWIHFSRN